MARVVLENLLKIFPEKGGPGVAAVKNITLEIEDREFMVLVGPSGCGKSTTLRMIAGLEEITSGTVTIGGQVVNEVLPKDRDIAMVFQNYALYPHMTVYENMAFGLKLRKFPKADIEARVREAATMLGLEGYLGRKPKALSGGQRQRVALGRAIVRKPKVFLFDEPLSNLDAKMRVSTRTEISKLHARLGATMIYVTHDQVEAMTMGDRICVMKDGNIMQVAEPLELYNRPGQPLRRGLHRLAADELLQGHAAQGRRPRLVRRGQPGRRAADDRARTRSWRAGPPATSTSPSSSASARRRSTTRCLVASPDPGRTAEVRVEVAEPMGSETLLYLYTGATSFIARVSPTDRFDAGQKVQVTFDLSHAHLFDAATELALK